MGVSLGSVGELEKKWAKSGYWTLLVAPSEAGRNRSEGASVIPRDPEEPRPEESAVIADPSAPANDGAPQDDGGAPQDDDGAPQDDGYEAFVSRAIEAGRAERQAPGACAPETPGAEVVVMTRIGAPDTVACSGAGPW